MLGILMILITKKLLSPILSLLLYATASSFLTTLLPLQLQERGVSPWLMGSVTALFYSGLIWGALRIESYLIRVGFIRAYVTLAAMLTTSALCFIFTQNIWIWLILRFFYGAGVAGLCLVIENWFLKIADDASRGRVLGLYMLMFYIAQVLGQSLLRFMDIDGDKPYSLIALLSTLSIIPMAWTHLSSPVPDEKSILSVRKLAAISPSGMTGSFGAGMMMGAFYGLMPAVLARMDYTYGDIATLMVVILLGGMLLQYPIGKLSDFFPRRWTLMLTCVLTTLMSILLIHAKSLPIPFSVLCFFYGGVMFTIYPLSINVLCDFLSSKDIVAATGGLLVVYSMGAVTGPLIVPGFLAYWGTEGMFLFSAVVAALLMIFVGFRSRNKQLPETSRQDFLPLPRTTPAILQLDPRGAFVKHLNKVKNVFNRKTP